MYQDRERRYNPDGWMTESSRDRTWDHAARYAPRARTAEQIILDRVILATNALDSISNSGMTRRDAQRDINALQHSGELGTAPAYVRTTSDATTDQVSGLRLTFEGLKSESLHQIVHFDGDLETGFKVAQELKKGSYTASVEVTRNSAGQLDITSSWEQYTLLDTGKNVDAGRKPMSIDLLVGLLGSIGREKIMSLSPKTYNYPEYPVNDYGEIEQESRRRKRSGGIIPVTPEAIDKVMKGTSVSTNDRTPNIKNNTGRPRSSAERRRRQAQQSTPKKPNR